MDAPARSFTELAPFCAALAAAGIDAVVVRRVHELRPRTLDARRVEVGLQRWTELAAYGDGVLFTAHLAGADAAEIEAQLRQRGLRIRAVKGNIT